MDGRYPGRVRLVLAEDHGLVAEAFQRLLEPEFEVTGIAHDEESLLRLVRNQTPDAVLLDLYLPGINDGLSAGQMLKRTMPRLKIIVVTVNDDPNTAAAALNSWASGYVLKRSLASELPKAVREVIRGRKYVTPALGKELSEAWRRALVDKPKRILTPRQRQVLELLAQGCTMKETATILNVTARTVAFHKYRIMREFGVKTNAQLVYLAMKERVIYPSPNPKRASIASEPV